MHAYRTHTCGALRAADAGQPARLSGWVHAKRDHGGLLFIDLRDHYGITQCVFPAGSPAFAAADAVRPESVITVTGQVVPREAGTVNPRLPTGEIELRVRDLRRAVGGRGAADAGGGRRTLPRGHPPEIPLHRPAPREAAPQHHAARRRDRLDPPAHDRGRLHRIPDADPDRVQPEGARAFLVPARLHPGKFYALPQAPQQFKQLAMVAGFDRYFQIAPCFRDEASRADRSPGEFYQLDFEMSFVTQEDVFATIEPVIAGVFEEFAEGRAVGRRRRSPASPTTRRCWSTAPTSRTCAIRCGSATSRSTSPVPASACLRASPPRAGWCARSRRRVPRRSRAASSTS